MSDEDDIPAPQPRSEYVSEGGELSRRKPGRPPKTSAGRKPGRPPKTSAGVNNTQTNYIPSVERNNVDQALQPTGDGDIAGDVTAEGVKVDPAAPAIKLFPVRLKRNYHPISPDWMPMRDDGSYFDQPKFENGETPKVRAGFAIGLPIEEARNIIAKGIAERADPI